MAKELPKKRFDVNKLLEQEISSYDSFTNKTTTWYGKVYFNPLSPWSWDCNHAHIINIDSNSEDAIRDIVQFYRKYNIVPRIYMSFAENEVEILRPHLECQRFTLDVDSREFMIYPSQKMQKADASSSIRRITRVSEDIIELIHTEERGDWSIDVINISLKDNRFHLLGTFDSDKCLSIASVRIMDDYSRIADVITHRNFRGQHYATELMSYLVNYHANITNNCLYLWSHNPIAIKLYENVGFKKISINKTCWQAYLTD
jgi:ribosomal protein S18 acetylase RimI-like enzyme